MQPNRACEKLWQRLGWLVASVQQQFTLPPPLRPRPLLRRWERQLQQLADAKLTRLRLLEERQRGITQAWQWLQAPEVRPANSWGG